MNSTTKRILAIGVPLATVAATGVAFATWTATGLGSGAAKADTAVGSLSVSAATATADLYPGNAGAGKLYITVTSTKSYTTQFTHVKFDATKSITDGDSVACPVSNVTFADQTLGTAQTVSSSSPATFSVAGVTLDGAAPDGCQGMSFTIPVTVS